MRDSAFLTWTESHQWASMMADIVQIHQLWTFLWISNMDTRKMHFPDSLWSKGGRRRTSVVNDNSSMEAYSLDKVDVAKKLNVKCQVMWMLSVRSNNWRMMKSKKGFGFQWWSVCDLNVSLRDTDLVKRLKMHMEPSYIQHCRSTQIRYKSYWITLLADKRASSHIILWSNVNSLGCLASDAILLDLND